MSITADQERGFYDAVYSRFLERPDHELAVNREVMRRTLSDPRQPVFERRRLYSEVLSRLLAMPLSSLRVLDYGCGPADWGVWVATEGAQVTLLDLSPAAVELGLRRARASGVSHRVRGEARDAADLTCFGDGEFDLVYASAAVHHTLKYPRAFEELVRVIRPGGTLLLAETYGNNPLLDLARRVRAGLQGEAEEQGEEIILGNREIALLRSAFTRVELHEMNLLAMGKRLLRGWHHHSWAQGVVSLLEGADALLLGMAPFLRRYCGEVVVAAVK
ncbi:MAG: class I SAM-dependent methyltransferase [Bryobacterales bacterium]|nr:class I SAM-dependent methyltransferase [Bryobacterales bacterium]